MGICWTVWEFFGTMYYVFGKPHKSSWLRVPQIGRLFFDGSKPFIIIHLIRDKNDFFALSNFFDVSIYWPPIIMIVRIVPWLGVSNAIEVLHHGKGKMLDVSVNHTRQHQSKVEMEKCICQNSKSAYYVGTYMSTYSCSHFLNAFLIVRFFI